MISKVIYLKRLYGYRLLLSCRDHGERLRTVSPNWHHIDTDRQVFFQFADWQEIQHKRNTQKEHGPRQLIPQEFCSLVEHLKLSHTKLFFRNACWIAREKYIPDKARMHAYIMNHISRAHVVHSRRSWLTHSRKTFTGISRSQTVQPVSLSHTNLMEHPSMALSWS